MSQVHILLENEHFFSVLGGVIMAAMEKELLRRSNKHMDGHITAQRFIK